MVPYFPFLEAAYMAKMCGGSGVIQSLSVTQNGSYEAPEGVDGYNPVLVNVPDRYGEGYSDGEEAVKAKIGEKHITQNGTYYAVSDGLEGFDPVIVNNPYETLYRLEHGDGEDIDTGIPDDEGNNIIVNGKEVTEEEFDNIINAAFLGCGGPVEAAISDGYNVVSLKCELVYSTSGGIDYVDPKLTITNLKTGESASRPDKFPFYKIYSWKKKNGAHAEILKASSSAYFSVTFASTGYSLNIPLSRIGISDFLGKNDKYYVLGLGGA